MVVLENKFQDTETKLKDNRTTWQGGMLKKSIFVTELYGGNAAYLLKLSLGVIARRIAIVSIRFLNPIRITLQLSQRSKFVTR